MSTVNKQLLDAAKLILEQAKANSATLNLYTLKKLTAAIAAAEQAQRPCQYCNGTGDVHSITGEWRSVCSCEAGKTQQAELAENAKLATAIQQADLAEVAAEAERRQADPGRPQAVGFFSGWVEGGEDGQPVEFMVTAYGEVPPVGAKLYTQPPAVADRDAIRRIFMAHGFTIKEGQTDLKPYVYEAAEALLRELSPAVAVPEAREFFAYDPECGFETFRTEAEAKKYAQDSIDSYREEASEGWPELVNNICWGVVLGATREVELPDEYNGCNGLAGYMKPVDYVLTDAAQPPAQPVARDVLMEVAKSVEYVRISGGYAALNEEQLSQIVDAYTTQPPVAAVPNGYALVPKLLTQEMHDAGRAKLATGTVSMHALYRAMLAAAPQATAEDSSVVRADAPAPATEYSWSENGEQYHGRFSSVEEAVCDYLDTHGEDAEEAVHIGEVKPHEPSNPIWLADNVLETLGVQAHDEVGECVEDWPELPPEKREQLGKMIQDFVWTHDTPRFFSIGKSEPVEVAPYRDDDAAQKGGDHAH